MNLIYRNKKFIFLCSYYEKDTPKNAGFKWDAKEKCWWTADVNIANDLSDYADSDCQKNIEDNLKALDLSLKASYAGDSNFEPKCPAGLSFLPFQKAGIEYSLARENILLADDMGLGKTVQAIGVSNCTDSIKKILIICPASVKINWYREFKKWDVKGLSVTVLNSKDKFPSTNVVIMNFDIVSKYKEYIDAVEWDFLVIDEAHALKNSKSLRSKNILGSREHDAIKAKKKMFLTGTPIVNRPIELWPLIRSIDPSGIGSNWKKFVERYCAGEIVDGRWNVKGSSNLEELQNILRSKFMVRRMKRDVLTELPEKRRQMIVLEPSKDIKKTIQSELDIYNKHQVALKKAKIAAAIAKKSLDKEQYKKAILGLRQVSNLAFTEMAKERHKIAVSKLPQVIEYVEEALENGKVILFAHHRDIIEEIKKHFGNKCVAFVGGENDVKRQSYVDRFQTDEDCVLFIGGIRAAAVGITLTAASNVIFAELDWTPGMMSQCEDRAWRHGQRNAVLVQHIVLNGSLDQKIAQTLMDKQEIIDNALDHEKLDLLQEDIVVEE